MTRIRTLLSVNGSKTQPVMNVTVDSIGFRDARATYMDDHGVPSGGDWSMKRPAIRHESFRCSSVRLYPRSD